MSIFRIIKKCFLMHDALCAMEFHFIAGGKRNYNFIPAASSGTF